jgi:predicted nucleic acid-binding protein
VAPVVADAGPLIALSKLDQLELLQRLFHSVNIPPAVSREVAPSLPHLPPWITVLEPSTVGELTDIVGLHVGEIEAIALARDIHAAAFLVDDLPARRMAGRLGLTIMGTAGILLLAKRLGMIPSVRQPLESLRRQGFRLRQDVYEQILVDADEAQG